MNVSFIIREVLYEGGFYRRKAADRVPSENGRTHLVNKAVRKGRTEAEVREAVCWLTGYGGEDLERARTEGVCYGDFFRNAPRPNPDRTLIRGVVCGVRVEEVADPLMREIRYLDKLVDEIARGKPMEKVLRKQEVK